MAFLLSIITFQAIMGCFSHLPWLPASRVFPPFHIQATIILAKK